MKSLTLGTAYVACLLVLAACGTSSNGSSPDEPDTGLLRKVTTAAELEASLKAGLTTIRSAQEVDVAIADALAAASGGNFTGTYTQDKNVDEFACCPVVSHDAIGLFAAHI